MYCKLHFSACDRFFYINYIVFKISNCLRGHSQCPSQGGGGLENQDKLGHKGGGGGEGVFSNRYLKNSKTIIFTFRNVDEFSSSCKSSHPKFIPHCVNITDNILRMRQNCNDLDFSEFNTRSLDFALFSLQLKSEMTYICNVISKAIINTTKSRSCLKVHTSDHEWFLFSAGIITRRTCTFYGCFRSYLRFNKRYVLENTTIRFSVKYILIHNNSFSQWQHYSDLWALKVSELVYDQITQYY
jgi:hypothetical protein